MIPNPDSIPLYGCVTGFSLPVDLFQIAPGITLRRGVYEIFSAPMLAFTEAPKGSPIPGPWVAIQGGHGFRARCELALEDLAALERFTPSRAAWLIAALLRLRIAAPVRIAVIANIPLAMLVNQPAFRALPFEASPYQIGLFAAPRVDASHDDLTWIADTLPIAARLLSEDRFMRALTVFDESVWSSRVEQGTVFIWTAMEILFGVSGQLNKTKAICSALSSYIGADSQDRDKAYNEIRKLLEERGRIVHAGRDIEQQDFFQSYALARAAFLTSLGRGELPPTYSAVLH